MKIFISPSVQDKNMGVGNYGTEEYRMNLIADVVMRELAKHKNIELKRNTPDMDWTGIRDSSNNWNADYHVAIHGNAGGGQGCEIYHYVDGTENNSLKLARRVYARIEPLTPSSDRGLKSGMGLFEVNDTINAASILIEVAFQDNWTDATFMIDHKEEIGMAIVNGIIDHLTIDRKKDVGLIQSTVETPVSAPQIIEKIVYVDKPVEVIKEVKVEVPVEVIKTVEVPIEKIVYQDKIIYQDKIVELQKEFTFKELILEIIKYIKKLFIKI